MNEQATSNDVQRSRWATPIEFVLSCLTYAIGLGNVWRFPYLCYRNGGGAFLVAYTFMMLFMGLPIFLLELIIGQYSGMGPDKAFTNLSPIFNGLGYCCLLVITLVIIYYMVIIGWIVFYFFASFTWDLPYGSCDHEYNKIGCYSALEDAKCAANHTYYNKTCTPVDDLCRSNLFEGALNKSYCFNATASVHISKIIDRQLASYEFFRDYCLGIKDATWDNFGDMNWYSLACLSFSWLIGFLCVVRGVKTSGKVVYFTTFFPYFVLTALVIQGLILEGSDEGVRVYLSPNWEMLLSAEVWGNAASQVFYSFGISCGSLITLSSYSNFYNNCISDAIIVTATNFFTSLYAGLAIFSMLGFLARQMDVPVDEVATDGPGLAFVAYMEAILRLPGSAVWAIAFFFMLFNLGLGSQFAGIEAISCLVLDRWPTMRKYQTWVILAICVSCLVLGVPMCAQGGIYLFTLMEWNTASWAIMLIGLAEVGVVAWVYGCHRFMDDMAVMRMGMRKGWRWVWWATWNVITPISLVGAFAFQLSLMDLTYYEDYFFPMWANALGWLMGLTTIMPLFVGAVYILCKKDIVGKNMFKETDEWLPQHRELK